MTKTTDAEPTSAEPIHVSDPMIVPAGGVRRVVWRLRSGLWRAALLIATVVSLRAVDATWNYAVQISAAVTANPPQITLSWVDDTTQGIAGYRPAYTVARRELGNGSWGAPVSIPTGQLRFVDTDVTVGVAYEYQVARTFQDPAAPEANHVAYGYIVSGIDVPFPDRRGKAVLVVEHSVAAALADRIERLRQDLIGDGWTVKQINVASSDSPASVRDAIRAEHFADAQGAAAVFLLGHVPVARAGSYAPDGHEARPMPCDAYYGDVDGNWVDADGDGVFDGNVIASDVELEVGRVDFADLDGIGTGKSEQELIAQYLDKDHAFRVGDLRFGHRALIGDRIGIDRARAPAASGYRTFSTFFGPENIVAANVEDDGPDSDRWFSLLQRDSYAWAFGSGSGAYDLAAFLGTEGQYKVVTSADLAANGTAGFYLLFGSYFLEWQQPDDLLRAALASPKGGLGAAWSGRPNLFLHQIGLGETIGYGVRLSQNNSDLYFSPSNAFSRGVHIAWMGDPTLRLEFPKPVRQLSGARNGGTVTLTWLAPADASDADGGFCVYRANPDDGTYSRLTPTPIADTSFTDSAAVAGATYLVRGIKRQQTASGTYQNPSEAATWTDAGGGSIPLTRPLTDPGTARLSFPLLFTPPPDAQEPGPRAPTP